MKTVIMLSTLITTISLAAEVQSGFRCITTETCVKNVRVCKHYERFNTYDSESGILTAYAGFSFEERQHKLCLLGRGQTKDFWTSDSDIYWSSGNIRAGELRSPDKLEDVSAVDKEAAKKKALENCEADKSVVLEKKACE